MTERLAVELQHCLPTPLIEFSKRSDGGLWVKDDGKTALSYGGNKVRKLVPLLADAVAQGKTRIVTVGAAGSHHVLATTLFGRRERLNVAALLTPQHKTPHAVRTLRCALGLGLEVLPLAGPIQSLRQLPRLRRGDYFIAPGAMGAMGAEGYVRAVFELGEQLAQGALPVPDRIVVACGTGSTAAGLLVGLAELQLPTRVHAVCVNSNPATRPMILAQVRFLVRKRGGVTSVKECSRRLELNQDFVGPGYGYPSAAGERAVEVAKQHGLPLENTYTGKAFAAALSLLERPGNTLFWNTYSGRSLKPLLAGAPEESELPEEVRKLLQER